MYPAFFNASCWSCHCVDSHCIYSSKWPSWVFTNAKSQTAPFEKTGASGSVAARAAAGIDARAKARAIGKIRMEESPAWRERGTGNGKWLESKTDSYP